MAERNTIRSWRIDFDERGRDDRQSSTSWLVDVRNLTEDAFIIEGCDFLYILLEKIGDYGINGPLLINHGPRIRAHAKLTCFAFDRHPLWSMCNAFYQSFASMDPRSLTLAFLRRPLTADTHFSLGRVL